jgi:hypothetical protein
MVFTQNMIRDSSEVRHNPTGDIMISSASRSNAISPHEEPIMYENQVNILNKEASIRKLKVQNDLRSMSNGSGSSP